MSVSPQFNIAHFTLSSAVPVSYRPHYLQLSALFEISRKNVRVQSEASVAVQS